MANIGWVLGPLSGWLVDIGLDVETAGLGDEIREIAARRFGGLWETRTGGEVRHIWVRVGDRPVAFREKIAEVKIVGEDREDAVEVKWGGYRVGEDGTKVLKQLNGTAMGFHWKRQQPMVLERETAAIPEIRWADLTGFVDEIKEKMNGILRPDIVCWETGETAKKPRAQSDSGDGKRRVSGGTPLNRILERVKPADFYLWKMNKPAVKGFRNVCVFCGNSEGKFFVNEETFVCLRAGCCIGDYGNGRNAANVLAAAAFELGIPADEVEGRRWGEVVWFFESNFKAFLGE